MCRTPWPAVHVRDEAGRPCHRADRYAPLIRRIRDASDLLICVSTSGRIFQDFERRAEVLFLEGDAKPDLASLTTGSFNFPTQASVNAPDMIFRLAETMVARGIKPEIEVFDTGMLNFAKYLDRKLALPQPLYLNLLLGSLGGIPGGLRDLAYLIQDLPEASLWSATGLGRFQLPMTTAALLEGGGVRVGLEDNLYYDAARLDLATNPRLVARVARLAAELERPLATPDQARQLLGLPDRRP